LTRIAVHESLRRRQGQRFVTDLDDVSASLEAPGAGPEHMAATAELRRLLEASIDRLPDDFRTVFILRDVEGLSVAETAETLTIPEETVKTRLHRARRRLQHDLERAIGQSVRDVFPFGAQHCDRLVAAVMSRVGACEDTSPEQRTTNDQTAHIQDPRRPRPRE
jgi:RNA polymerase sigma-70 factor (ECF subfamily)